VSENVYIGGRVAVITHKACWPDASSASGHATDGGFPFQMHALSGLFEELILMLPLAPGPKPAGAAPLEGKGLQVVPLTPLPSGTVQRRLLFPVWLLRNLSTYRRQVQAADAVHALVPGDVGTLGMLLARMANRPLLVRHCGNWNAPRNLASGITQGMMEHWAGGRRVMLATGGEKQPPSSRTPAIRWIFSSSLTEGQIRQLARPRAESRGANARLIIACRQEPAKGTAHVLDALPLLAQEFGGISLEVLGEGSALAHLRQQAESLGVASRVKFLGQVDHGTVIERMQQADLFVFPTTSSEGFPKAVLEALACGLPVVTTAVSVLPNLVGPGAGVILPSANGEAVAGAVGGILRDANRYQALSRQALATASRFSLERWRDEIGRQLLSAWGPLRRARGQAEAALEFST